MPDPSTQSTTEARIDDVSRQVCAAADPEQAMRTAVEALVERCGYAGAGVALVGEGQTLELCACHPGAAAGMPRPADGPMGEAARKRATVRCEPASGTLVSGARSVLAIPLIAGARLVGALEIDAREPEAFQPPVIRMLEMLGRQLTLLVDLSGRAATSDYLEKLIAGAGDGILTIDCHRRIVRWNRGMETMLGHTGDAMRGGSYEGLRAPESRAGDIIGRCLAGETLPSVEDILQCKDGRRLHAALTLSPIRSAGGVVEGISLIVRDVTERKNMEESFRAMHRHMREAEERFLGMIERANDAIFILDARTGEVIQANARAEAITGMNRAEMVGRRVTDLHAADEHRSVRRHFEASMNGGGDQVALEVHLVRETEGSVTVAVISRILNYGGRDAVEWLCRDISDRRMAEQQRETLQRQLLQSEKVAAIGQLIGGVAHELNNPLTGVIGYAELLASQATDEKLKRGLERVHSEARRCHRIVDNLLAFARAHKAEKIYLSINDVIESTLELCAYQLRVDNIRVQRDLQADLPRTMADFHQMQQVFTNVIINAHQAIHESNRKGTIKVRSLAKGGMIRVEIADNGTGIRPEDVEKIFHPFFSTRPAGQGAGLGLSICAGILQEHDGRIWAVGTGKQETQIVMELPVQTPAVPRTALAEKASL